MKCTTCGQFGHLAQDCKTVPQSRVGCYLGGIVTLEHVRDRCHIDEDSGCWNWRMGYSRTRTKLPVAWIAAEQRTVSVIRWVYTQTRAKKLGKMTVWRTCGNQECVNPDHLIAGSKAAWGKWMIRNERPRRTLTTEALREMRIASGKTVLDMEKAHYIRQSEATGAELARELGVSAQVVSRVRTGKTWVKQTASSVWAWAQSQ